MKKIVADLEVIKQESLESLGFSKETTIYAICEKNAQVPIAFMTQISSFAGKFITIENEKADVETAKAFLIGYLAGSSSAKDEIALVSEDSSVIDSFKKLFPKISIKVYPTLAAAAGKRTKKPQAAKAATAKSAPVKTESPKPVQKKKEVAAAPAKKTIKKENTLSKSGSGAAVKTAKKTEEKKPVSKEAAPAESSAKKKRKTKAENGDYSELLEALKPIDREYPFEEKITEIYTAIHDSLMEESLEMMLRLHIGKDWEYLLGLLKPHFKKLKRLAG